MDFNSLSFGTNYSRNASSSLHDSGHASQRRDRGGIHSAAAAPSPAPSASPFIFTLDGNGLLTGRAASSHGACLTKKTSKQSTGRSSSHNGRAARGSSDSKQHILVSDRDVGDGGYAVDGQRGRLPLSSTSTSATLSKTKIRSTGALKTSLTGLLPSAAPLHPLVMRGVRCVSSMPTSLVSSPSSAEASVRPSSALVGGGKGSTISETSLLLPRSKRPNSTLASTSHAKPRFNNYVIGRAAATSMWGTSANRPASASQRPPRVPTTAVTATTTVTTAAASPGISPLLARASSSGSFASEHLKEAKNAEQYTYRYSGTATTREDDEGGGDGQSVPATTMTLTSASRRLSAVYAPAPVRPLLRRPQIHTTVQSSTRALPLASARAANDAESAATRQPPHNPLLQMTRTSALRRSVFLTKNVSTAAAAEAAASQYNSSSGGSSCNNTPRASSHEASPSLEAQWEEKEVAFPLVMQPADEQSQADVHFTAYAPAPPPPRGSSAGQPWQSRKASLASVASNSSASLQQPLSSQDEEAVAPRLFFHAMPSFQDAAFSSSTKEVCNNPSGKTAEMTQNGEDKSFATLRRGSISITSQLHRSTTDSLHSQLQEQQRPLQPQRHAFHASRVSTPDSLHSATLRAGGGGGSSNRNMSIVDRLRERGNQYMMHEEFAQAIATYSEGIRLAPSCDVLWGNRAAAFLLTFRYLLVIADCLYVLYWRPGSVKAYWRAAKAYAAAYRFLEAKKYYLLAQRMCFKDDGGVSSATSNGISLTGTDSTIAGGLTERTKTSNIEVPEKGCRHDKATKVQQAIAAEVAAVESVNQYWQHVRAEHWSDAVAVIDNILSTVSASYTGPTAVSWQALRLEALLPTQPKVALAEAEALHRAFPEAIELYYVLAKALFYTVHDAASTRRCLQLLDDATAKRNTQNTMLNVHVRYAAMQLRDHGVSSNGDAAAAQLEAWARRNQLREDSRVTELRHSIAKFVQHRDAGNSAYEKGNWDAAAAAYSQCLQTDRHNYSLLAAVYCNRTAVYMQAGRWREALSDADAAISLSPHLATAHGRRGRILLYLLWQEYEAQRAVLSRHFTTQWSTAVKEQLMHYADAAVADLTRAVELSPTTEHKNQLQQALAQRQTMKAALRTPQPGLERSSRPSSSFRPFAQSNGASHTNNNTNTGFAYQRSYAESRSSPPSSPPQYGVLQQHLRLLGLNAGVALPDFKVVAKAYRESALRWHPDKWVTSTPAEQKEAERQFKLISVAYTALRERYNDEVKTSR